MDSSFIEKIQPFLREAQAWLIEIGKKRQEKSSDETKDSQCICCIPDHDYAKVMKYLKRTKLWRITFDGDTEPTIFKMIDNELRAYDTKFPQGRKVIKTSDFQRDDFVPTSTRGLLDHMICTFNGSKGFVDENIELSRSIYDRLPEGKVNTHILFWTAFFIMAKKFDVRLNLGPQKNTFMVVAPDEMVEEDASVLHDMFHTCLNMDSSAE